MREFFLSRINAFIEQRRNIVVFLSTGFDRLARLSHDVSGFTVQKQTVANHHETIAASAVCATRLLIFINATGTRATMFVDNELPSPMASLIY